MQSSHSMKNCSIYFNGHRLGEVDSSTYTIEAEAVMAPTSAPTSFTIQCKLNAAYCERFGEFLDSLQPPRERKKKAAEYRRNVRRQLVRFAGRAGAVRDKSPPEIKAFLLALGVRIPRSLR